MVNSNSSSNEQKGKSIEEIHIWDFPSGFYIKLPTWYRTIFFQLVFLEFGNIDNLKEKLKANNLSTNLIRWRDAKDNPYSQLTNLKALLFLQPHVMKRRNKIKSVCKDFKLLYDFSSKKIKKTPEILFLFKQTRYILKNNANLSKILEINPHTLSHYISDNNIKKIPSNIIFKLIAFIEEKVLNFDFSLLELENKVIAYKSYHGKQILPFFQNQRKLPIKINPEFESILFHLLGDGYVAEIGSSEYTQVNLKGGKNFLCKLFHVFGYFDLPDNALEKGRVYISKTLIKIIVNYYGFKTEQFKWDKSKLPVICFNRNEAFKLAGLISFIVDEAHVGKSGITIYSSNKVLLSQIRQLAYDLGLESSEIKLKPGKNSTKDSFRFYLYKRSVKKLFIQSKRLEEDYSSCNFAQKEAKISQIAN